jgi:ATP-dependent Clp protease ATP-binding subunit ClpB
MILNSKSLSGKAKELEDKLNAVVIGQEEAIKELAITTQKFFNGLSDPKRPITSLFFAGKTGCGKTKAAEELAKFFGVEKFLKVNCGEFQQSHEISKLIGSPPGYIGHSETKAFFNKKDVEETVPNIILFDEVEKATDSLFHLLLSILDKGEIKLGNNDVVNFRNCFIIFTSNIGVEEVAKRSKSIGFVEDKINNSDEIDLLNKSMKAKFRPEFMNRIESVIKFNTLNTDNMKKILELELSQIQYRIMSSKMNKKKVFFVMSDDTKNKLIEEGFSEEYGARNLKRVISKKIEIPLSCVLADDRLESGDIIEIKAVVGEEDLIFEKAKIKRAKTKTLTLDI